MIDRGGYVQKQPQILSFQKMKELTFRKLAQTS
jgi:hypothetical protein